MTDDDTPITDTPAIADSCSRRREAAARGLSHTIHAVQVHHHGDVVGLGRVIADGEAHRLSAQFGFEPTTPKSIGMAQVLR